MGKRLQPENSPDFVQAIAEDRAIKVEWPDGEVSFSSYPNTTTRDAVLSNLKSGMGFFAVKASPAEKVVNGCAHVWRIKVNLFLDIDYSAFHSLSKATIRTDKVRVEGADWPNSMAYCEKCGVSYPKLGGAHP